MVYEAIALNRKQKLIILTDDTVIPFASMLDADGEETDDPRECALAIIQLPNGKWSYVDLSDFDETSIN